MAEENTRQETPQQPAENIDEFLPLIPDADSVVTTEQPEKKNAGIFSRTAPADLTFLDQKEETDQEPGQEPSGALSDKQASQILEEITNQDGSEENEESTSRSGRPKTDKSGLVDTFTKLIESGKIIPFDDEKPLEKYSLNDFEELIDANFQERERQLREQTPKEFFEALPQELQYAAKYVMDGGQDMKGLFRALSQVEEVRQLDPENVADQSEIARQYLRATRFGSEDEIEEEIETWQQIGTLGKKANQFKPKLDKMQEEVVAAELVKQEQIKAQRVQAAESYRKNVHAILDKDNLNGIKLNTNQKSFLLHELTQARYQSISGRPTNLLGHLLEKHQYSETPRYDLIAEATWLLNDPESYRAELMKLGKTQLTEDTVRKLKTEEGRKINSSVKPEHEPEDPKTRKLPRPANIFRRN